MGEVGASSAESPHVDLKMNGGINGSCEDEQMDVDAQNDSEISKDTLTIKNTDEIETEKVEKIARQKDSNIENDMEIDSDTSITNKNGANCIENDQQKKSNDCDSKLSLENSELHTSNESDSSKMIEDSDAVKIIDDTVENLNERTDSKQSTENGTSARSKNDNKLKTISNAADDEVHAISDSDDNDDEIVGKPLENPSKTKSKSNGVNIENNDDLDDDDKAVSIHSSDSETENETSNKDEVHEILSDKEDCVVIEDDKKIDRPINRSRKSAVRARDFSAYDDDIEEIIDDPLETAPKKPRLADPLKAGNESQQFHQTSNKSKEPTLVIIDTNTILSRGSNSANLQSLNKQNVSVMPVGVPAQGVYPIDSRTSITPVPNSSQTIGNVTSTTLAGLNAPVLTALTDDMFVLEAPSFIVPYIYEKPASEDLKEIVVKMAVEIEERKKQEKNNEKNEKEQNDDDNAKNVS